MKKRRVLLALILFYASFGPFAHADWPAGTETLFAVSVTTTREDDLPYADALAAARAIWEELPQSEKAGILPSLAEQPVYIRSAFVTFERQGQTVRAWRFVFGGWKDWAVSQVSRIAGMPDYGDVQLRSQYIAMLVLSPSGEVVQTESYVLNDLMWALDAELGPVEFWPLAYRVKLHQLYWEYPSPYIWPVLADDADITQEEALAQAREALLQSFGVRYGLTKAELATLTPCALYMEARDYIAGERDLGRYFWYIRFMRQTQDEWVSVYTVSIRNGEITCHCDILPQGHEHEGQG